MTSMKSRILKKLDKHERAYVERLEVLRRLVANAIERGEITEETFKRTLRSIDQYDEYAPIH